MCRANDWTVRALAKQIPEGASSVRPHAGMAAKPAHYRELLTTHPPLALVEVQAENPMGDGGPPLAHLDAIAPIYLISPHGVGMSLGGAETLDRDYLALWRMLVNPYDPVLGGSSFKTGCTGRISGSAQLMPL